MTRETTHSEIQEFEARYKYDAGYMHELLDRSPDGFRVFSAMQQVASFRQDLPAAAYYVAAITVMQTEDCGSCLQLNVKMAQESGVAIGTLRLLLESPENLPAELKDIRHHTESVLRGEEPDIACAQRIESNYGAAALAELALCVAGVRIYPTLKRALRHSSACLTTRINLDGLSE